MFHENDNTSSKLISTRTYIIPLWHILCIFDHFLKIVTEMLMFFLSIFLQIERSLRSSGTTAGTTTSPTPIGGQLVSHMTFAGIWFHLQSLMETFVIISIYHTRTIKVENILDSITFTFSNYRWKVCLGNKAKHCRVMSSNVLFSNCLLTMSSNVLPLHIKETFLPII